MGDAFNELSEMFGGAEGDDKKKKYMMMAGAVFVGFCIGVVIVLMFVAIYYYMLQAGFEFTGSNAGSGKAIRSRVDAGRMQKFETENRLDSSIGNNESTSARMKGMVDFRNMELENFDSYGFAGTKAALTPTHPDVLKSTIPHPIYSNPRGSNNTGLMMNLAYNNN